MREAYGEARIEERHRHRYEVNNPYRDQLEAAGLVFSGTSPDHNLVEFVELPRDVHPYYVSTQAHPELRSRPTRPHPLFAGLVGAAIERQKRAALPDRRVGAAPRARARGRLTGSARPTDRRRPAESRRVGAGASAPGPEHPGEGVAAGEQGRAHRGVLLRLRGHGPAARVRNASSAVVGIMLRISEPTASMPPPPPRPSTSSR